MPEVLKRGEEEGGIPALSHMQMDHILATEGLRVSFITALQTTSLVKNPYKTLLKLFFGEEVMWRLIGPASKYSRFRYRIIGGDQLFFAPDPVLKDILDSALQGKLSPDKRAGILKDTGEKHRSIHRTAVDLLKVTTFLITFKIL